MPDKYGHCSKRCSKAKCQNFQLHFEILNIEQRACKANITSCLLKYISAKLSAQVQTTENKLAICGVSANHMATQLNELFLKNV